MNMNEKSHPHFNIAEKQTKRERDAQFALTMRERIQHTFRFPTRTRTCTHSLLSLRCCSALVSWLTLFSLFLALVAFVSRSSAAAGEKDFQFVADIFS